MTIDGPYFRNIILRQAISADAGEAEYLFFENCLVRIMATYGRRLEQFISDRFPAEEVPVKVLCRDRHGTYVLPYSCCRFDDEWRNFETDETVLATVIGWRTLEEGRSYRPLRKK